MPKDLLLNRIIFTASVNLQRVYYALLWSLPCFWCMVKRRLFASPRIETTCISLFEVSG